MRAAKAWPGWVSTGNPAHRGVAGGGAGVEGQGIEEEVSLLHAAEVLGVGHSGGAKMRRAGSMPRTCAS